MELFKNRLEYDIVIVLWKYDIVYVNLRNSLLKKYEGDLYMGDINFNFKR